mmetsp:Transcript_31970/g.106049  ORF Transcript_31970/g.106049 Transcript_31970/m.106049 type:complete len:511 (+) Transcript_31970:412-1944(+)
MIRPSPCTIVTRDFPTQTSSLHRCPEEPRCTKTSFKACTGIGGPSSSAPSRNTRIWKRIRHATLTGAISTHVAPNIGTNTDTQSSMAKGVKKPRDPPAKAMTGGMAPLKRPAAQQSEPSPPMQMTRSTARSSSSSPGVHVRTRSTNPGGSPSEPPQPHFCSTSLSLLLRNACGPIRILGHEQLPEHQHNFIPLDSSSAVTALASEDSPCISFRRPGSTIIVTPCESAHTEISRSRLATSGSPCLATRSTLRGRLCQRIQVCSCVVVSNCKPAYITAPHTRGTSSDCTDWASLNLRSKGLPKSNEFLFSILSDCKTCALLGGCATDEDASAAILGVRAGDASFVAALGLPAFDRVLEERELKGVSARAQGETGTESSASHTRAPLQMFQGTASRSSSNGPAKSVGVKSSFCCPFSLSSNIIVEAWFSMRSATSSASCSMERPGSPEPTALVAWAANSRNISWLDCARTWRHLSLVAVLCVSSTGELAARRGSGNTLRSMPGWRSRRAKPTE